VGSGVFFVKFDGRKLVWTLVTNDSGHKSSVGSTASSTSKKCLKNGFGIDPSSGSVTQEIHVYPNPVTDRVIVTLAEEPKKGDVIVLDIVGRPVPVQMNWRGTTGLELEMDGKPAGVYIIRVAAADGAFQRFRIVKQ
jgi:hypothetical protein